MCIRDRVNEAIKTAEPKRKEAVLEAKDEAFKLKAEVDAQKAEACLLYTSRCV